MSNIYESALRAMRDAREKIDLAWPLTKAAAAEAKYLAHWFAVLSSPVEKPKPELKPEPATRRGKQISPAERLAAVPDELRRQAREMKRMTNALGLQGGLLGGMA